MMAGLAELAKRKTKKSVSLFLSFLERNEKYFLIKMMALVQSRFDNCNRKISSSSKGRPFFKGWSSSFGTCANLVVIVITISFVVVKKNGEKDNRFDGEFFSFGKSTCTRRLGHRVQHQKKNSINIFCAFSPRHSFYDYLFGRRP
jgi:hypothetical protein